jgi:ABC-2 type transport system permease protein
MRVLLDFYRTQFKVYFALQLQYRVALIIWLIGMVLEPVIYLVVWTTVARSSGGSVGTYTGADFAAYFIALMLVNHATFTWIMFEFEWRIRQGLLSPKLLKPIHPIHADIADNITYKTLTLAVMLPVAAILALAFRPAADLQIWNMLAFLPALVLAFLLRFFLEWALALAAFWTTRVSAINQMYYVLILFLSGQVAPLSLFPPPIQTLANLLPFRWIVAFPVELVLGRRAPQQAVAGFVAQAVWLIVTLLLLRFVWRAGVRRYSAVGS